MSKVTLIAVAVIVAIAGFVFLMFQWDAATVAHSGTVTEKVVEPERQYSTVIIVNKVPITQRHTDDEDYCLRLVDGEKTGYSCIDKETFDSLGVGDYYKN